MVLSNGTPNNKNKKINTKNSGLRHVSTKPSAQRRSDQNSGLRRFDETVCIAPLGPIILSMKFPLAQMGVLGPGSVHVRPSARPPIDTSKKFLAHLSA